MFIPQTYPVALLLMTLGMLRWGSWATTQKITRQWPFVLYYFDYTLGLLVCSLVFGLTLGQIHDSMPESFFLNLRAASQRSVLEAFAGGTVFSVGNMLIVGAISVAGMAVAFPIGAGSALILGAVLNLLCRRRAIRGLSSQESGLSASQFVWMLWPTPVGTPAVGRREGVFC